MNVLSSRGGVVGPSAKQSVVVAGAFVLFVVTAGAMPASARPRTLKAAALVSSLKTRGLVLSDVVVTGRLDLRPLLEVRRPFVCHRCVFTGRVLAADVVFRRTVDVSGSRFERGLSMPRAVFEEMALFGAEFDRPVDFSLATFDDLASFEDASFGRSAAFSLTRFRGGAVFADAELDGSAQFVRTSFTRPADFRDADFEGPATFERADFADRSAFANATFAAAADFQDVTLEGTADFVGAVFGGVGPGYPTSFERLVAAGDVDFDSAEFDGRASFKNVLGRTALSLRSLTLSRNYLLNFDSASALEFSMDVDQSLAAVRPADREHVLGLIEDGAKRTGDLTVANEAHYELEVLRSRRYRWPRRVLDVVAYRTVAGYLVRPLQPLGFLLGLAAVVALVRAAAHAARPLRMSIRRAHRGVPRVLHEFLDALALIGPRRAEDTATDVRRIEAAVYRVLLACALIGLANSNPTLRQMFDALL